MSSKERILERLYNLLRDLENGELQPSMSLVGRLNRTHSLIYLEIERVIDAELKLLTKSPRRRP